MPPKNKKVVVYLDGVDWQHEIGVASDGNKVYPDIDNLKECSPCWNGCGIVECELVFKKWVVDQNWNKIFKTSRTYSVKEMKKNSDILRLESANNYLKYLEDLVSKQKHKVVFLKVNLKKKGKK